MRGVLAYGLEHPASCCFSQAVIPADGLLSAYDLSTGCLETRRGVGMEYARGLGREHNMSSQRVNNLFVELGILEGTPNNYNLTELGKTLGVERTQTARGETFVLRKFGSEAKKLLDERVGEGPAPQPAEFARVSPDWGNYARQYGGMAALILIDALTPHLQKYAEQLGGRLAEWILNRPFKA